jgi:predicted RNase H-like nuclease (RuvC/YqgF family)
LNESQQVEISSLQLKLDERARRIVELEKKLTEQQPNTSQYEQTIMKLNTTNVMLTSELALQKNVCESLRNLTISRKIEIDKLNQDLQFQAARVCNSQEVVLVGGANDTDIQTEILINLDNINIQDSDDGNCDLEPLIGKQIQTPNMI